MAAELGADHAVFCFPGGDSQGYLYDQRGRIAEYELAQNHQDAWFVPERGGGVTAALDGAAESLEEMEFRAELARGAEPVSDFLAERMPALERQ